MKFHQDFCKTHHQVDEPKRIPRYAVEMLVHSIEDDGSVWCWWELLVPDDAIIDVDEARRAVEA
jgi:hypothetical protein